MSGPVETNYRVWCDWICGPQFLTDEQYDAAMNNPDEFWKCPNCHGRARWDDAWYEAHVSAEAEGYDEDGVA